MKITCALSSFCVMLLLVGILLAGCNRLKQPNIAIEVENITYKSKYTDWQRVEPIFFFRGCKNFDTSKYVFLDGYYSIDMKVPYFGKLNPKVSISRDSTIDWYYDIPPYDMVNGPYGDESYKYYNITKASDSHVNYTEHEYMTIYPLYYPLYQVDANFVMDKTIHKKVCDGNLALPSSEIFSEVNVENISTGTSRHGYDYITYFKTSTTKESVDVLTYIRVSRNYIAITFATVQRNELTVIDDVIDSIEFKQIWTRPAGVADDYIGWQTVEISPSWSIKLGNRKEMWIEGEHTLSIGLPTDLVSELKNKNKLSYSTYPLYRSRHNMVSVNGCIALYEISADFVFDEMVWEKLHPDCISYTFEHKYASNFGSWHASKFQKGVTDNGCEYVMSCFPGYTYGDRRTFTCIKVSDKFIVSLEIACQPDRDDDAMRIVNSVVLK